MKIGIYGGTFDPVHLGHLVLAETAREKLSLDLVIWIPAGVSPFKTENLPAEGKHRIAMLEFALAGYPQMKVDKREIKRGGISYTVDTLREFKQEYPLDELFLLMGGDSLQGLSGWKDPEQLCSLAKIAVVNRGDEKPALPVWQDHTTPEYVTQNLITISMTAISISSHDLRTRVSDKQSIRFEVPRAVENYILQHKLYTP